MKKFHGWIYRIPSRAGYRERWGYRVDSDKDLSPLPQPITKEDLTAQRCVDEVEAHFGRQVVLHETANVEIGLRIEVT